MPCLKEYSPPARTIATRDLPAASAYSSWCLFSLACEARENAIEPVLSGLSGSYMNPLAAAIARAAASSWASEAACLRRPSWLSCSASSAFFSASERDSAAASSCALAAFFRAAACFPCCIICATVEIIAIAASTHMAYPQNVSFFANTELNPVSLVEPTDELPPAAPPAAAGPAETPAAAALARAAASIPGFGAWLAAP